MNTHTPEQAKGLWCPMVRASNGTDTACNAGNTPEYRTAPSSARCIADKCAMWRWAHETANVEVVKTSPNGGKYTTWEQKTVKVHGACGLAGPVL